jgi:hypothetical protein
VEFYCSLEEGVPERVAPAVFGFPQRRNQESKLSGVCFGGIRNMQSTSGNRFFWLRRYSIHAEHHVGVTARQEIILLKEIQH